MTLSCDTCGGSGYAPLEDEPEFDVDVPCPDCVDGIPRTLIETVAEAIFDQRITGVKKPAPFGTFRDDEQYRVKAVAVLKSLRDREETE